VSFCRDTFNGLDPLLLPLICYAADDTNNIVKYRFDSQKEKSKGFNSQLTASCIRIIQMAMNWARTSNAAVSI
jgi:hypothetical protein